MNYKDARGTIKSGDLFAWSHRGLRSWYDFKVQLVRLWTRSEYSHVGCAWVVNGRVFVIESVSPLARIVPLSNLLPCFHIPMRVEWTEETEKFALSLVGKAQYSQWEAIASEFGWYRDPFYWQCAEFYKAVAAKGGVVLSGKDTPSDVVHSALVSGGALTYLMEATK